MMLRRWLPGLLFALLAAALVGWFLYTFEWVTSDVDKPPRGEARYNRLYALAKTLQHTGIEVVSRPTLDLDAMALVPGDVLLLATEVRVLGEADVSRLLEWVTQGGHLLFALPATASDAPPLLLDWLGLAAEGLPDCVHWRVPATDASNATEATDAADATDATDTAGELCGTLGIEAHDDRPVQWAIPEAAPHLAMHVEYGRGSWTALPDFRFLSGRGLSEPPQAALAWALLDPLLGEGRVHLVYATELPPLYVLVLRDGWPAWIPVLVLLLLWLWRRSQRFGPVLPLPSPHRRALLEHLHAAGEFALRRKRGTDLHAVLKRRFHARLSRTHPGLAALQDERQVQAIASAWVLDPASVRQALMPADLSRPDAFASSIRFLYRLQALI